MLEKAGTNYVPAFSFPLILFAKYRDFSLQIFGVVTWPQIAAIQEYKQAERQ